MWLLVTIFRIAQQSVLRDPRIAQQNILRNPRILGLHSRIFCVILGLRSRVFYAILGLRSRVFYTILGMLYDCPQRDLLCVEIDNLMRSFKPSIKHDRYKVRRRSRTHSVATITVLTLALRFSLCQLVMKTEEAGTLS